jgi:ribosomal protein S18 acetylase RimI-like enzyme
LEIRTARPDDAGRIAEIQVRGWQQAYAHLFPAEYLDRLSVSERTTTWRSRLAAAEPPGMIVAELDGNVVGWLSLGPSRDPGAPRSVGEVWGFYVDPSFWNRGIGKALWSAAESAAKVAGWQRITLWVLEGNATAREFYHGIGLTLESDQKKLFQRDGHSVPEVRYARDLSGRQDPRR